ncbi:HD-GYP domain-containing protein [Lederbergia lenta]|uniref:HD-GYP domain-containing protein n=1 Tax=Lederbergia lenta TaxID=1467 RepID=UPI002040B0F9|nr:HD-GYP domain-containing protein [Lederbergia lenta]
MRVRIEEIQADCILEKDVMGKTKNPIIAANTVLDKKHIHILRAFLIKEVDIQVKMANGDFFKKTETKMDKKVFDFNTDNPSQELSFTEQYRQAVEQYKKEFQSWQSGLGVNMSNMRKLLIPLIEECEKNKDWIKSIHLYSNKDEYLYHHAIGIAMISHFLAKGLGYDKGQSLQAAIAGCLADCGMARVALSTLNKLGALNENDWIEIKKHPTYSYQMVKMLTLLKPEVKLAIYQHHERLDGSGYPRGEKGIRIHQLSQIVAIADVYHAMTTERPFKNKRSPFKILQIMEEDLFGQFDIAILKVLATGVASLSVGSNVKLSNGEKAKIVYIKPEALTRPLIKIKNNGNMVDLEKNRHLYIEQVIN